MYKLQLELVQASEEAAAESPVQPGHVERAFEAHFSRKGPIEKAPSQVPGNLQSIISRAARGNFVIEWLSYAFTLVLLVLALGLLLISVFGPGDLAARANAVSAGVFTGAVLLVPLRLAVNSHRHRFAIELLGRTLEECPPSQRMTLVRELLSLFAPDTTLTAK